jgi:hypothetical protein
MYSALPDAPSGVVQEVIVGIRAGILGLVAVAVVGVTASAQSGREPSPTGTASAQVLGTWVKPDNGRPTFAAGGANYQGGKWIDITYGRPLLRGRDPFGTGPNYGKELLIGAPIWRAGANVSTRLKTEVPLMIGGKTVPAGEYSIFIDLREHAWTLVVSSWAAQQKYDPNNKTELWGAYEYTPDKDVLRTPMTLQVTPHTIEQLTWQFLDMTNTGGTLAISWAKTMASVTFKAAQ